jgi:hypothetical protein
MQEASCIRIRFVEFFTAALMHNQCLVRAVSRSPFTCSMKRNACESLSADNQSVRKLFVITCSCRSVFTDDFVLKISHVSVR